MKKKTKVSISFHDDLVATLRDDEEAQIEFIKANFEDNGDEPSAILTAIRTVAEHKR
ncbi:MAG: hypothetical protein QE271_10485 [Bacteriovoracaceae bacterium]|nr:hypothetical protein [Bacteriovoracaceae bacterium]